MRCGLKRYIPDKNIFVVAYRDQLIAIPGEFVNWENMWGVAFLAADDLVEFEVVAAPNLDTFVHTRGGKIGQGRMESDMVNGKQMRRDIFN